MWQLRNLTPFAANRAFLRDREGREVWIVAVRGSFTLQTDGSFARSLEQEPVQMSPTYWAEPTTSSLRSETDIIHDKPGTDVLVEGHVYAPRGEPTEHCDAAIRVSETTTALRVFGDRYWERTSFGFRSTKPNRFEKMPLRYERAFGGVDFKSMDSNPKVYHANPVGVGFVTDPQRVHGCPLPNFERIDQLIQSWDDKPNPVGFGPIARTWKQRQRFAGTFDERWENTRQPLPPDDYQPRFQLCAPETLQCVPHLLGGESVTLLNLTPNGAMHFKVPRVHLGITTRFRSKMVTQRTALSTLIIRPDSRSIALVWVSALVCQGMEDELLESRVWLKRQIGRTR